MIKSPLFGSTESLVAIIKAESISKPESQKKNFPFWFFGFQIHFIR